MTVNAVDTTEKEHVEEEEEHVEEEEEHLEDVVDDVEEAVDEARKLRLRGRLASEWGRRFGGR